MSELDALASQADKLEGESAAADFVPEVQAVERQPSSGSLGTAGLGVYILEMLVKAKWQHIAFSDEQKDELCNRLAVVLDESGGALPEWLVPYESYLKLGACLGGMAVHGVMQDMAYKQAIIEANQQAGASGDKPGHEQG